MSVRGQVQVEYESGTSSTSISSTNLDLIHSFQTRESFEYEYIEY